MHGKNTVSRRSTPQKIHRRMRAPSSTSTPDIVDIGDWSLAQDEDGALIIHNVITGNRIIVARP